MIKSFNKGISTLITIIIIVLFIILVGGVVAWQYLEIAKKEVISEIDPLTYGENNQIFSVTKNEFKVLDRFNTSQLQNLAEECGRDKDEHYFKEILNHFSEDDKGLEYKFNYLQESQDKGEWIVTIIPNKIGYADLEDFKEDFDICFAGRDRYPSLISENYLLFVSSCGTGYDDGSGRPHGCQEVQNIVEPTIKLK